MACYFYLRLCQKSTDSNAVFTVRFKMYSTTTDASMNFTTSPTLLHYLVKVETSKLHVNTNLTFNVKYEIAVIGIKLH